MKQFKGQVVYITLMTFVWLMVLLSVGWGNMTITLFYIWRLLAISVLFGGLFGFMYPYVWSYLTWSAVRNSIVMTLCNTIVGFNSLYLFSAEMFHFVWPYFWAVLLVTLGLHLLMYQWYRKIENKKLANELNRLTKS